MVQYELTLALAVSSSYTPADELDENRCAHHSVPPSGETCSSVGEEGHTNTKPDP